MLETMYVRCTHCGYDNSPEYRFCGMCGASLAHQTIPVKPPLRDVVPIESPLERPVERSSERPTQASVGADRPAPHVETVSGPSFLGLADEPTKSEFHYLYEDEPPRSYVGLLVVLLIAVGIGGAAYWQWSRHGYPFNQFGAAAQQSAQSSPPSETAPANPPNQQTPVEKEKTNSAPDVQPTDASPNQQTKASTDQKEVEAAATPPKPVEEPRAAPAPSAPASHAKVPKGHASVPKPSSKPASKPPATLASESSAAVKAPPDADLELAGERALYGNGVPKNCAKAESSLRSAATHSNPKAQTVLGTMYATGHCVGRDLPTAYRWFARALHLDPQNSRISADLQILWRQMSAEERQLATASGQ